MKIEPINSTMWTVTIGKQKFRLSEENNALEIMGYSNTHTLQVEPRVNNVIHVRVKEIK